MTVSGLPFSFYDEGTYRAASKVCGAHSEALDELYGIIPEHIREKAVKMAKNLCKSAAADFLIDYVGNTLGVPMNDGIKKAIKEIISALAD